MSRTGSLLLALFCLIFFQDSLAQPALNGSATQLSCNCFQLTEEVQGQFGTVWNSAQIDISVPFDYKFDVYLGDNPGGADGIAFVLQPVSTSAGTFGQGLGYEGIVPSLAIQIDTYQNTIHSDMAADHVAIMSNGSVDHASADNLAGPDFALISGFTIEDGQWHVLRVTWDPVTMTINVYMDGPLRLTYTGDIINDIFGGDPMVFWGFTGSTGLLYNVQKFCFKVEPGLSTNTSEICEGESISFDDNSYSALGQVVDWYWDFGNGQTSTDSVPTDVLYSTPGSYWVTQTIVDAEGCDAKDSIEVNVRANPQAEFSATDVCLGEETDLVDQSTISSGTITEWEWDLGNGETDSGSSVSFTYAEAGTYEVGLQVTTGFGCTDSTTSTISVFENPVADATYEATGPSVQFSADLLPGEEATWTILDTVYSGQNPFNYTFPDSGNYVIELLVINENGCMDTSLFSIHVEAVPQFETPNVFTPNGDLLNDWFRPETYSMVEANMKIFNRWGRPVFTYAGSIPPVDQWGWDGTVNGGAKAAEGTYYYLLDLKGIDGSNFSEQGTVTLLR